LKRNQNFYVLGGPISSNNRQKRATEPGDTKWHLKKLYELIGTANNKAMTLLIFSLPTKIFKLKWLPILTPISQ